MCPFENNDCCMARILSKQEDFTNQISMLEAVIREAGHLCIFLPKFHCELNPIEMVSFSFIHLNSFFLKYNGSTRDGLNIRVATNKVIKIIFSKPKMPP